VRLSSSQNEQDDWLAKSNTPQTLAQKSAEVEVAFSQLLSSAVDFCEKRGDPGIFASEALQVVVAYKWELYVYHHDAPDTAYYCRYMFSEVYL
jgi:hypothetical protein